ncbi:MAG TPA: agmatinase [Bacteroidales bacterium]|nr:agmatinase [Bacteroidales bacterium]HQN16847.1 agmatinase [Bacteroidales bacterium]HQP16485.1 agmatinase [Bacteroidales bacterium]
MKATNFGGISKKFADLQNARIVVMPVPYDGTSTWIKGADKGPDAILEASANMELYDIETNSEVYKQGIYTSKPVMEKSSPEKMTAAVYKNAMKYVTEGKMLVTIGGEHSVSVGAIQAYAETYDKLTVLQFDAHSDMRPEYEGSLYNHACAMARAIEFCPVVQVGIRSMDVEEKKYITKSRVFFAEERMKNPGWMDKAVNLLSENVYITIDLDVFDPSIMPSTGTPEPGGLFWYEVLEMIRKVNKKCNIVGFDVVELCPNKIDKAPDFLASKLIYKILSYKFNKK